MKRQRSFADQEYERFRKKTRRKQFLEDMNSVVPWRELAQIIEPHYPTGKGPGRPPVGLERMLRIYFLQNWFNLSDPSVEESLYDMRVMREFNHYLALKGMKVNSGTIVDATIISAPSSTKNKDNQRDPEMNQVKKGNEWHFGMKMHIGVDSRSGIIHSVKSTSANVHDSQVIEELLHGEETRVWGDSAYLGQREKILSKAPHAQDFTNKRGVRGRPLSEQDKKQNTTKSKVRARVSIRCAHWSIFIVAESNYSDCRRVSASAIHKTGKNCPITTVVLIKNRLSTAKYRKLCVLEESQKVFDV